MSIQSDIVTALAGVAGDRVYAEAADAETARPFVIYRKVGSDPVMTLTGYAGITNYTFMFECWGDSYASAMATASAVRAAIESAAALKPQTRLPADADDYEPVVDEFVEPVLYSFWAA